MQRRTARVELNQQDVLSRLIVLIAVTTGMRVAEIFSLGWSDVMYGEGLLAMRTKLKGGKIRYVPMLPELAGELRRFPAAIGEDRIVSAEARSNERTAARRGKF